VRAKPIFIDICNDGNIDLDLCIKALKKDNSIKALYGVSFSGNMLNQDKLQKIKKLFNIKILEDNAHSIGASFKNIKAGSCQNSDISIFSFHPVKHITTGEGGAITTNSKEIYDKIISLRNHGTIKTKDMKPWAYEMINLGFNYRLSDIGCALGISQLNKLDNFIKRRVQIAKQYDKAFENTIITPLYTNNPNSSYHLYVVRIDFTKLKIIKEDIFNHLKNKNINIQLHYIPINKQLYYKSLGYGNEKIPIMDKYYNDCFSIPIFPLLKDKEIKYIVNTLISYINQNQS
jgi:dTDP-4-amino-4,6-dideoxygalactose transaminase